MRDITVAITAASYSGNKGAAAMLQSSIKQLHDRYGDRLKVNLMSVYPSEDREQVPHDFVDVVPCKPQKLIFIAFPLAILYVLLGWIPGMKSLLCKNKILKAYRHTDLVIDEAGISFVDSRGFVMNTYAFITMAVPMLLKVPVVKYSQAMGTFKNPWNRFLAKWILPKMKLICARGQGTLDNLKGIGIEKNVKLCADGAFTMEDDMNIAHMVEEETAKDEFFSTADENRIVGLSISSVVDKKCTKRGIDYKKSMVDFVDYLTGAGYKVLIIANAARINSEKPRNNDLLVGDAIYNEVQNKGMVRWYHKEMDAEEIREYIGRCRYLVASRFHSMIGALERKCPVLLIGWSHKYQEVLDMFGLGQYAIDFSNLQLDKLIGEFERFVASEDEIRNCLDTNYDKVMDSSKENINYISEVIDEVDEQKANEKKPSKKKTIMKFVKIAFLLAVLVFMVRYFYKNWDDIKSLDMSVNWGVFVGSMILFFIYKLTQASLWHYITYLDHSNIKFGSAITCYLYSILGKYIPGKVFMLAARIPTYEEQGVPMRKTTICFLLENVCTMLGAGFLFLLSLFFFPNDLLSDYLWAVVVFIVVFIVCINPKIINFFLRMLGKLMKKDDMEIPFSYFQMLKVVFLFVLNWLIVGTGFYLLTCSIYPVPASQWLYVGGVYGLSVIIGLISLFAPSGIGVREGIMILGFNLIMPEEYSVVISIVSRLWITIAELILILGAFIVNQIVKRRKKKAKEEKAE